MRFSFDRLSGGADSIWRALSEWVSGDDSTTATNGKSPSPKEPADISPTKEQLIIREQENRRFLEQIARQEPLPNILKHLVDVVERQNPALRVCFTLMREGRVLYAVAPTLGGKFASAAEDVAAAEQHRLGQAQIICGAAPIEIPVLTRLAADPLWARHNHLLVKNGLVASWSVPIMSGDEPVGNLSVYTGLSTPPTRADIDLLSTTADRAAIAIEHQELIERQGHESLHDPLTALPNRALLEDRLQHAIDRGQRGNWRVALFIVNIDRFKLVNDSLGHGGGDELLRQIAERLRKAVRVSDTVARVGADEFAVVVPELRDRGAALAVAEKLLSLLGEPSVIAGRELITTASVGAALFPDDGSNIAALHRASHRALHRAKLLGRNRHSFYDSQMGQGPIERAELEMQAELRRAIENGELSLNYQPQVDASGKMVAVEALLRWRNAKLGQVSPAQFIPVAEQTGLIVPIGEWVLRQACIQAQKWNMAGVPPTRISVNVSALQFAQPHFLRTVEDVLRETGLAPSALELELTESLLMQNTQDAAMKLSELRRMGVAAAIDDFGTGYSSLAYLRRLPIDTLKIDRSFVSDVGPQSTDDSATAVIRAILSMAQSLGLHVVAEGVETEAQSDFLIQHGCKLMQGYLYGRPQSAGEITAKLASLTGERVGLPLALSA